MQTHEDYDANHVLRKAAFMARLEGRATEMSEKRLSQITAGKPGEEVIDQWQAKGVHVKHLPDDEQGILRISIGGGETPVPLNYCVFRGQHHACVDLLRKALRALEQGHND